MTLFEWVWLVVAAAGTVTYALGTLAAGLRQRRRRPVVRREDLRISVLKPIGGLDPGLEQNLASFAALEAHPDFEVLLSVASEQDPAVPLLRRFVERDPRRFALVVGADRLLRNQKMAQLTVALPRARNELLWISESNVETSQAALESLFATWRDLQRGGRRPTLVHAPLVAVGGTGLGARLERMYLASSQNAIHEVALLVGLHLVVGKAEFMHRDDLAALGGLATFGDYLGEDYLLGQAFAKKGVVRCAPEPSRNVLGALTVRAWLDRHVRWAVMRKTIVPAYFLILEPLMLSVTPVLFAALGLVPWPVAAALVAAKAAVDATNYALAARAPPPLLDVLAAPLKELLLAGAWLKALGTFEVTWRGGATMRLGRDSLVVEKVLPGGQGARENAAGVAAPLSR